MNDGFNKYTKQQEAFVKQMTKIYTPPVNTLISQSHIQLQLQKKIIDSDGFKNFQKQMELTNQNIDSFKKSLSAQFAGINLALSPMIEALNNQQHKDQRDLINRNSKLLNDTISAQMTAVNQALSPIREVLSNQKQFLNQMNSINIQNFDSIQRWHSSINHLVDSQSLNLTAMIPESFYAPLGDIAFDLENSTLFCDENQDVLTGITARKPVAIQEQKMTWAELIVVLLTIWQVIYLLQSDHASALQREELISEMKINNELTEKQIDIDEQKLIIAEQSLELDQMKYELQKRLEERFDAFTESIDPFITEQLETSDDDYIKFFTFPD